MKDGASRLFSRFPEEQKAVLRRLDSPRKVQDFLEQELSYNGAKVLTCFSPLEVLKRRRAHCIEGAMLAAAAFLFHGRRALLLDLRANSRDDDHVLAPFIVNGKWGAVAQSRFCGLRFREPVYGSSAELARSYFEFYYNNWGEKTLREFSAPLDLLTLKPGWLYSAEHVFFVGEKLDAVEHFGALGKYPARKLRRADPRLFEAEVLGGGKGPLTDRRARPYSGLKLSRRPF